MTWVTRSDGWIVGQPSRAMRDRAMATQTGKRHAKWPGKLGTDAAEAKRAAGRLGEWGLMDWLDRAEIPYEHNGGEDDLPDFVIAGRAAEFKTRHGNTPMRPSYNVGMPDHSAAHEVEWYVHAAYEMPKFDVRDGEVLSGNRLILLGFIHVDEWNERAEVPTGEDALVRPGDLVPCTVLQARHLYPLTKITRLARRRSLAIA